MKLFLVLVALCAPLHSEVMKQNGGAPQTVTNLNISGGNFSVGTSTLYVAGGHVGIATTTLNNSGSTHVLTISNGGIVNNTSALEIQGDRSSPTGRIGSIYGISTNTVIGEIDFYKDGFGSSGKITLSPKGSGGITVDALIANSSGTIIISTFSIKAVQPADSQALCIKTGVLGYCTSLVGAGGGCTCVQP